MRILVTGGSGFIGSALIRYLLEKTQATVLNLDKLTYAANPDADIPFRSNPLYQFVHGDICDTVLVTEIFSKFQPDAVMHLAAESHVDNSISAAGAFIATNIQGTYTLLEVARHYWQNKVAAGKGKFVFHHVSTDEVYGDLKTDTAPSFIETSAYAPSSPYAASKAASDHLVRAWHRTYGLPVVISNCSNNFGPWQHIEKLIPRTIIRALSGGSIPVYGSGLQRRDWLYVDDHAEALFRIVNGGTPGQSYNIGGNCELANIDMVRQICLILDELLPAKQSYTAQISFVADRPGHDVRYAVNCNKIQSQLDWTPQHDFREALRYTVGWYLQQYQSGQIRSAE